MSVPSPDPFSRWAERIRAADQQAFAELYDRIYAPLHRFVWYILRDEDATDDVIQEVFVKLWQVRHTLDPERSLKALLYQMARNFALNHTRTTRRFSSDDITEMELGEAPSHDAELTARTLEERLRVWIDELPPRRREAFCLSRFENMSHDEIAVAMDLAPKTVNNHIVLALQTLRQRLIAFDADALADG